MTLFDPLSTAQRLVLLEGALASYVRSQQALLRALSREIETDAHQIRDALQACDRDLSQLSLHLTRTRLSGPPLDAGAP